METISKSNPIFGTFGITVRHSGSPFVLAFFLSAGKKLISCDYIIANKQRRRAWGIQGVEESRRLPALQAATPETAIKSS
jgi:hypothetical protein